MLRAGEYFRLLLIFVQVFIQLRTMLFLVLFTVHVHKIILVLVRVCVQEKPIIFVFVFVLVYENNIIVPLTGYLLTAVSVTPDLLHTVTHEIACCVRGVDKREVLMV